MPTAVHSGHEKIGGAHVHFKVEVPEEITDPNPLVIAPGYLSWEAYDDVRNAVARNGKIAITFDTSPQERLSWLHPSHVFRPSRLLSQSVYAAMRGARKIAEHTGMPDEKFDLSGHSMSGRSVVEAALLHPHLVRTVIPNQSPGLYKHNFIELAVQAPALAKNEMLPTLTSIEKQERSKLIAMGLKGVVHHVVNPYRTATEGISIGNCADLRPRLALLGELGIKTIIMVGQSDGYISAHKTKNNSLDAADMFVTYSEWRAGHFAPQVYPLMVAQAHAEALRRVHFAPSLAAVPDAA